MLPGLLCARQSSEQRVLPTSCRHEDHGEQADECDWERHEGRSNCACLGLLDRRWSNQKCAGHATTRDRTRIRPGADPDCSPTQAIPGMSARGNDDVPGRKLPSPSTLSDHSRMSWFRQPGGSDGQPQGGSAGGGGGPPMPPRRQPVPSLNAGGYGGQPQQQQQPGGYPVQQQGRSTPQPPPQYSQPRQQSSAVGTYEVVGTPDSNMVYLNVSEQRRSLPEDQTDAGLSNRVLLCILASPVLHLNPSLLYTSTRSDSA